MNLIKVASSNAFKVSWEEYKVRKMANACRSGRKSWRGTGEVASTEEYDPMGDNHSAFEIMNE